MKSLRVTNVYNKNFKYLGCETSCEHEKDVKKKKNWQIAQILGILNNTFKPTLIQKFSRIKIHNELTLPILLYGNEIWNLIQKDKENLNSVEMKFFRRTV